MKIVYVLVADETNYIPEMCALSVAAAKQYTPGVQCCIATDAWTYNFLKQDRPYLLEQIDDVCVSERIYESATRMSRHIKTSLRQLITGDFLFIDADAVPVQDITPLFQLKCDFGAVQNGNCHPSKHEIGRAESEVFEAMEWDIPTGFFLNSGVFFARDTEQVHTLFERWHGLWQAAAERGFNKDQPALNKAIHEVPLHFELLDSRWNAMISLYHGGGRRPQIVHYSTIKFDERNDTIFHDMVRRIRHDRRVDLAPLDIARAREFYWTDDKSVRYQIIAGNYHRAVFNAARKILRR